MRRALTTTAVLVLLTIGLLSAFFSKHPTSPKITIPLADGTIFTLSETVYGPMYYIGGKSLPRMFCKIFRRQLPSFIPYQPQVWQSVFTNGIALSFMRCTSNGAPLQTAWNGSGQLYLLGPSNTETWISHHNVCFYVESVNNHTNVVTSEGIVWDMPLIHDPILRFRIYETNSLTNLLTHDFQIPNPAL